MNGTWLHDESQMLGNGDLITLCNRNFKFKYPDSMMDKVPQVCVCWLVLFCLMSLWREGESVGERGREGEGGKLG